MNTAVKKFYLILCLVAAATFLAPLTAAQNAEALPLFEEGQELIQSEEFAKAAEVFQKCVDADDKFGGAWFMLGYALHMDKKYDQAIVAHKRAIEFDDDQFKSTATYNLACALALTGETDDSLETLQKAVDAGYDDPQQMAGDSDLNSLHPTTRFAILFAKLNGDDDVAEKLAEAQNLVDEQAFDKAAEIYRGILDQHPKNDFACYRLGYSLHGAGKLDEAITYHEKAAKFPGTKGISLYNWGCALSLQGKVEAAFEKLNDAIENGFLRIDAYESDTDLNNLRDKPEFDELLTSVREKRSTHSSNEKVEPAPKAESPDGSGQSLTWDNVEQWLAHEADAGFAGAVLLVRNGQVVLNKGYGVANKEKNIANTPETIFAIGSTPIDFTKASILLLAEKGKLKLSDAITKYFPNVPEDKQSMTIEHLMTGQSGLQDFHGLPSDENHDHSWIDRDEAIRRILGQKLRFAPGKGDEHSHSAFGLLAAIIEIVSEKSYAEFTRENLFKAAGMNDTGFFGEPIDAKRLAIGYGRRTSGEINAPPYWGKTSWLVMGSGGQVSTTGDLHRWISALHGGKILSPESLKLYFRRGTDGILNGGDEFGFEIMYTMRPENFMVIVSNNVNARPRRVAINRLGELLARLVAGDSLPKFSLGVKLRIEGDHGAFIEEVLPDSAAERDGLKAGDQLLKIGNVEVDENPMGILRPYLNTGEKISFEVDRDGQVMKINVRPNPR